MSGTGFSRATGPRRDSHAPYNRNQDDNIDQLESETLSASVDVEDIIDEYDSTSRKSTKTASVLSFLNELQLSQTYFSFTGANKNDDTTSFYSALQDGFSLDEYDLRDRYGSEFFLSGRERDAMLAPTDFEVTWSNLEYNITPKVSINSLWNDFNRICRSTVERFSCNKAQSYVCNEEPNSIYQKEKIRILQNINGSFKSGELTAILGPSGAGKTSLLNLISRRREEGFTGRLDITGTDKRIKISAIPQHDHLPEYLTVKENLLYASRIKNSFRGCDHEKNVLKVSNLLGLDDCLDTRTKNISGGQHKRLAIAQELLNKPDILILDEPTSGLDSLSCFRTLSVLKDLVKASARKLIDPIAIVLTIHQPQHEAFDLFDKVYVIAQEGIAMYHGPPDKSTQFVESFSGQRMPTPDYNPASFLIEIASGEYGQEPIKALERQARADFESSQAKSMAQEKTKSVGKEPVYDPDGVQYSDTTRGNGSSNEEIKKPFLKIDPRIAKRSSMNRGQFWLKTFILTERCWLSLWRDPKQLGARILFHIVIPLALAFLMGKEPGAANACPRFKTEYQLKDLLKGDATSDQVQEELLLTLENLGLLFVLTYSIITANTAATTLAYTLDMQSSLKEFYNGWYSMNSYIIARLIAGSLIDILLPTSCVALAYVMTNQTAGDKGIADIYRIMIIGWAVTTASIIGQVLGMIFGAIYMGHITTALFASQGATLPFVLLSGFVVRAKNMSKLVYAFSMTSYYRHVLELTFIARYGFNTCDCDPKKVTGEPARIVGVSEELKSFTRYWMNSIDEETTRESLANTTTTTIAPTSDSDEVDNDLYSMVARQISLYNTYGVEIKSCDDVKPYQLIDFQLTESNAPRPVIALILTLTTMLMLLFVTVRLLIHYRTSL